MIRLYRVGIDIGGTFTDCVAVDEDTGAVTTCKVPTTPHDQSEGFLAGIEALGIPVGRSRWCCTGARSG